MPLTSEQQKAFDEVKEKLDGIEQMVANSLNLQAYGGYVVRNEIIDMKPLLTKVEEA